MKLTPTFLAAGILGAALAGGATYAVAGAVHGSVVVPATTVGGNSTGNVYGGTATTRCELTDVSAAPDAADPSKVTVSGQAQVLATGGMTNLRDRKATVTVTRISNGNVKTDVFKAKNLYPFALTFAGGKKFHVELTFPPTDPFEGCSVAWPTDVTVP